MESTSIHPKNQAGKNSIIRRQDQFQPDTEKLFIRKIYRVQHIRQLSPDTYVLRFDRNDMNFRAGQHITLGIPGNNQVREYSIYSTEHDTSLEVLVKEVDNGLVSKQLKKLLPGEIIEVDGPFGYFTIDAQFL
jgi:NAD(P)H-flavin reductase